jgi:hypothetical protein
MDPNLLNDVFNTSQSARSLQRQVGPSEIGGCRRKVWHRLQGTEPINHSTLSAAAFMGTAIHEKIERRLADLGNDRYLIEVEVEYKGLMGHVDVYDTVDREVIDWKTITLKKVRYFPSEQQWTQVQIYGLLLTENGHPVDTVSLVGIPRDGNERDMVVVSRPWDRSVAEEALLWLEEVRESVFPPEPERKVSFCRDYCQFFGGAGVSGCPGLGS